MCGIAVGRSDVQVATANTVQHHRGPDAHGITTVGDIVLGHSRLAILDLDSRSDQPFTYGNTTITYNGELWNWKSLRSELEGHGLTFTTQGDTEVVAAALDHWGIDALARMDGMLAVVWTDGADVFAARDRYGEIPLHITRDGCAASELRALRVLSDGPATWLPPGHIINLRTFDMIRYYTAPVHPTPYTLDDASLVHDLIQSGTTQRMISDVPLCTLLSGGIDSSAIAYHLQQERSDLVAYTAVYDERSRDLRTARIVADALEIELVEVPVPAPTVDDLHTVVQVIEMPHKAQVEIGWPCLRLAQAMSSDGFKVTFTGEGSDELWASYGFAYHALKTADWHEYRRDLFIGQHRKNFARANKAFMAYGVEARLPFLHPALVDHALTLPETAVREGSRTKAVLEYAYRDVLPTEVINRPKVAFQDGMKLKQAISAQIADPARVYRDSFKHQYGTLAKP